MIAALRTLTIVTALLAASGCVISVHDKDERPDWRETEEINRANLERLELGMPVDRVRNTMGTPAFSEAFEWDGEAWRTLFYRTQRMRGDGRTTRDETTPVILRNGTLWGWGESAWFELTGRPLGEEPMTDSRY